MLNLPLINEDTKIVDENGKSFVAFWYRDTDEKLMNEVKEKFIYEIGNGNGYINPREFVNTNINNMICAEKTMCYPIKT